MSTSSQISPAHTHSPPHSVDAEKAVLGAALREPDTLNLVIDRLTPDHFFLDAHRQIYAAMIELYHHNEPTDILTVADKLRRLGAESEYLGPAYLVELTETAPVSQNIEHYSFLVRDYYYMRRIIDACQTTVRKALAYDGQVAGFIEDVEKEFLSITNAQDRAGITPIVQVLESTITELEEKLNGDHQGVTGVPTKFVDLDRITGGWQKSDLIIIAARPGMGKTAFMLNCALNAVKAGKSTAIFTLEMSKNQLAMRLIATEARVDSSALRKGNLSEDEQDRLMHGIRSLGTLPAMLGVDETPGINLLELRSRCRRFKKEHGLDLIIIDYLQLMTAAGNKKGDSREREISEISGGLKMLAKELQVPVIAAAQLNRGPENRPEKIPRLSDLRESGSMEQDADLIMFLYRDEYYNANSEDAGKALIKIAKNRHGSLEDVHLAFEGQFQKFTNLQRT